MRKGKEEDKVETIHEARVVHIRKEADSRLRKALKKKVREHKVKEVIQRENEKNFKGPVKVIGKDGKIIVKHGGTLRKVASVYITRIDIDGEENGEGNGVEEGKEE